MKLIEQSHEILHISENPLTLIEQAGRTCYKSENKIGCTVKGIAELKGSAHSPCYKYSEKYPCKDVKCKEHSAQKFVSMLINKGHHAMIEFADMTVRFTTNRSVTHELVRHRLCSFAQESQRYVKYDSAIEFIKPIWWNNDLFPIPLNTHLDDIQIDDKQLQSPEFIFLNGCTRAEIAYTFLLKKGWRPEQAREVLPNATKTEIVVKANFREWIHIFSLRTSKQAHPQMRALILELLTDVKKEVPVIFDHL